MNNKTSVERRFLFALLAIVAITALVIFYPFLTAFVLAGAFTILLEPIYLWINKHITRSHGSIASLITIILFLIVLCVPVISIGGVIFNQTEDAYHSFMLKGGTSSFIERIDNSINNILPEGFSFSTEEKIMELFSSLIGNLSKFFSSTFNTAIMFVLTVFSMFYLLKDGSKWKNELIKFTPLSEKHSKEIISGLKDAINRIFRGTFVIAIIQGVLAWLGLLLFGVPSPALWGVVAGLCAFVPTLGTSIVLVPAILFLFFSGMHWQAVGLLVWSMLLVGTIDNILSPYLISKKSEVPPLFILFSIFGGISLMGAVGIIIGPLVLSLLYTLVSIYREEIKSDNNQIN